MMYNYKFSDKELKGLAGKISPSTSLDATRDKSLETREYEACPPNPALLKKCGRRWRKAKTSYILFNNMYMYEDVLKFEKLAR